MDHLFAALIAGMSEPARSAADHGNDHAGGEALQGPARQKWLFFRVDRDRRLGGKPPQAGRDFLVEDRIVMLAQGIALHAIGAHPRRRLGLRRQVVFDLGPARFRQLAVDVSVEVGFGDRLFAHLTTRRLVEGGRPSRISRRRSRPRERRDMTVPTGMPSVAATSS